MGPRHNWSFYGSPYVDSRVAAVDPDPASDRASMAPPTTRAEADEALRLILTLPEGFLAKLYLTLYEGRGLRIDGARGTARSYLEGLTK